MADTFNNPVTTGFAPVVDKLPTREGYDRWSAFYDTDDNPLIPLEEPQVARLLGEVKGLKVLDVGCGTGRHSLRLAAEGAMVTGIDFSDGMLAKARAKARAATIDFRVHDLAQPLPFADGSFDRVVCGLVLDHIQDLPPLFREMRRVCHPAGFAVVSIMHPAMQWRGVEARFVDRETGRETRPASARNQLTDYIMAALRGGWTLEDAIELEMDEKLAERWPRARKYVGWPMLFLMRLTCPTQSPGKLFPGPRLAL